jgi:hypothetical protein
VAPRSVFPSTAAHDAHRTATTLTLLFFLWGALALITLGRDIFWIRNLLHTAVGGIALVYFATAWNRPRQRVAEAFCVIVPTYLMLVLPWTMTVWCDVGRPMEAFTVPQICMIMMALVIPGGWWLGDVALAVFAAESLLAYFYARHLGLDALIPLSEPFATVALMVVGVALRVLRRLRRNLAREHVRARSEIDALDHIRPLFVTAREALQSDLATIANATRENALDGTDPRATNISHALDRLGDLGHKLDGLVTEEERRSSARDAEQTLLDRDAQLGAILFAIMSFVLMVLATVLSMTRVPSPTALFAVASIVAFAVIVFLLRTQRRPSSRRALWAVLGLFAMTLPLVAFDQAWISEVNHPYLPFLGHKLLMVVLGLAMATRFKLGMVLIVATAINALALFFVLGLGARTDIVSYTEPAITILYMFIGLVSLQMNEQRHIASIQLLRREAESSAMHRRARLLLALRDRLNSPLQTLVLRASGIAVELSESGSKQVEAAIDHLIKVSRDLSELEMPVPVLSTAIDPTIELRRWPEAVAGEGIFRRRRA